MASLKSLIQKNTIDTVESNLERGRVWTFSQTSSVGSYFFCTGCFCWNAPAAGTVIIEAWGAGGSSSRMCCCGFGLPGNPGAYSKKTISVASGCWIYGCPGLACGNPSTFAFRGCSNPTTVCWSSTTGVGSLCAQGGMSGVSICNTGGSSTYCCFIACTLCGTSVGTGCGFVCNYGTGYSFIPTASGGDVNCSGAISCVYIGHCNSACYCFNCIYVKTSAGIFAEQGATAIFSIDNNRMSINGNANLGFNPMSQAIMALDRQPGSTPMTHCWASVGMCTCYEGAGCISYFGTGIPGGPVTPVASVRDVGIKGSQGTVRIQFIPS